MKLLVRAGMAALFAGVAIAQAPSLFEQIKQRLTANALKADVSFLASDALEGRGTPSRGLDIAAEYIAAQFRRAGLEPVGDDGYFQTAPFGNVTPNPEGAAFSLKIGGQTLAADKAALTVQDSAPIDLTNAGVHKIVSTDNAAIDALSADQVKGKVLLVETPDAPAGAAAPGRGGRGGGGFGNRRLIQAASKAQAALIVNIRSNAGTTSQTPQLRDTSAASTPQITVADAAIRTVVAAAKPGPIEAAASAHLAAATVAPVRLRNVVGLLRGSDPTLKDTYIVLTGHYDHLGIRDNVEGDKIFNGANDDASGTSSVIEIANALASLPTRPKRSIVFIALFGEERGDLGSHYYGQHPIFPLAKTIADVNLEQLGRTDETGEGEKLGQFNLTGFDYTDMPGIFRKYGEQTGIKVVKDEAKSDPYFTRSDNAAFAEVGVPATTLSVTYSYGDYHRAGDEWQKLNYENMAKVDWTIALAFYHMADTAEVPHWNEQNPKTEPFRKARSNR
jgi:Zn-dependent M28 family amino/carboxypeptidase